jgi:hypothetical protein
MLRRAFCKFPFFFKIDPLMALIWEVGDSLGKLSTPGPFVNFIGGEGSRSAWLVEVGGFRRPCRGGFLCDAFTGDVVPG